MERPPRNSGKILKVFTDKYKGMKEQRRRERNGGLQRSGEKTLIRNKIFKESWQVG